MYIYIHNIDVGKYFVILVGYSSLTNQSTSCQEIDYAVSYFEILSAKYILQGSVLSLLLLNIFKINDWGDEPEYMLLNLLMTPNLIRQLAHLKIGLKLKMTLMSWRGAWI